jgi:hypothetical protein
MRSLLDKSVQQLGQAVDRFPWSDRRAYADWLAQTYYYVRHSTRLLAAAAARFAQDERGSALHSRFAAHMAEEKRHELLCIHDLKALGTSIEGLPEHHSTRMFYEPQYYKIEHQAPEVLFGYILPLEAIGPWHGKRLLAPLVAAHGEKSVAFLKLHAAEDVEHLEKAFQILNALTENERRLVGQNVEQTTHAYVAMLEDIRRHTDQPSAEKQTVG